MKNIKSNFDYLINLTVNDAMSKLLESDIKTIRIVNQDGMPLVVTRDYKTNRLNVWTKNNIISEIVGIG